MLKKLACYCYCFCFFCLAKFLYYVQLSSQDYVFENDSALPNTDYNDIEERKNDTI